MKFFWLLIPFCLLFSACSEKEEETFKPQTLEDFYPKYNRYISDWLVGQRKELEAKLEEERDRLAEVEDEQARQLVQSEVEELERALGRIAYREKLGDYFAFKDPSELPEGLTWEDGMDEPEIGDPAAKKGGVFRYYIPNFPATLRGFGSESNNGFRSEIYDNISMALVGLHPDTLKVIPALAREWAVSEDGHTVYFKLDPDATYTDGVRVRAKDFMWAIFLRVSDNVTTPYEKQYYREQFGQICVYDEETLSVTLADAKPMTPYFANLQPEPPHFFDEYGPDFEERYAWRVPPSTGAYFVRSEDVVKGVSITLTRDKDWWAKDKKYYKNSFNADKVTFMVVRDEAKAFELFKAGEIDYFYRLIDPKYWYEKSESDEFFDGFIEKHQFYHRFPHIPRGIYLNVRKGLLGDRNVRLGIQHAINMQKIINVIFRGDYERLDQVSGGYGEFTKPDIKARKFSVEKAREYFAEAGFTETGSDGILRKPDGTRLSVSLSYAEAVYYPRVVPVLKEEARKAGLELRLEGQEPTLFYQQVMKKEHEMVFWGWSVSPPFPRMYQLFHSRNAVDEKGNLRQQTNNLNSYADPEMDKHVLGIRHARTEEELKEHAWAAQQIAHDEALFVPGWREPFARVGSWRWVRWPDSEFTEFAPPLYDRPRESYTWWIDTEMKEETLEAKRTGKRFEEAQFIHDRYRFRDEPLDEQEREELDFDAEMEDVE